MKNNEIQVVQTWHNKDTGDYGAVVRTSDGSRFEGIYRGRPDEVGYSEDSKKATAIAFEKAHKYLELAERMVRLQR